LRTRVAIFLGLTGAALRLLHLGWLHPLNWDEIEFFRATDWVARGRIPFRDFWEHHTPLQWLVFAPVARVAGGVGTDAVIAMRWAQVPLWIATFWLAMVWMRRAGLDRFARWTAIAIALCSSFLMLAAVEYRVDTLGCALYLAGLVLAMRMHERRGFAFAAGVVFCLAGFANLRLGPLLAITVLLLRIVDTRARAWRGNVRANWIFAGVLSMLAVAAAWFHATDSLVPMYDQVWREHLLGERQAREVAFGFVHRMLVPFGVRILGSVRMFDPAGIDIGGIAILALGLWGLGRALARWRTPDDLFVMGALQAVSLLFIAAMKFIYHYHFEIVVVMMLPLIALAVERIPRPGVVMAIVVAAWCVNAFASIFRGKELDLQYQDVIMRDVHARTRPGDKVWDGVGWAYRREPAYRFWFLPELARQLVVHRHAPPYRVADFLRDPPAAIVADHNALVWLGIQRDLQRVATRLYMPVWRNLWIPAMNARLEPGQTIEWVVPADGAYRLFASPALAAHPWFRRPLFVSSYHEPDAKQLEVRLGAPAAHPELGWAAVTTLRKGQRVTMTSRGAMPLGVFLVPGRDDVLFRQPPIGATLEGATARVTHVPRSW
jgi:hypothetical protein